MVWWLATVIISATYTANLAAFLSSSRWNQPINGVVKLAEQDDILYGEITNIIIFPRPMDQGRYVDLGPFGVSVSVDSTFII